MTVPSIATERLDLLWLAPPLAQAILRGEREENWGEGFPTLGEIKASQWSLLVREDPMALSPFLAFVIRVRESGLLVGGAGFHSPPRNRSVEIGYGLAPTYQGMGYATEAAIALTRAAVLSDAVDHIVARTDVENLKSQLVLKRAGFVPQDAHETEWRFDRSAVDNFIA